MRSRRGGYSLIELLAVLAVFSVTFATIVLTLHGLQRGADRAHTGLGNGTQQIRFARQLRADAHLAQAFVTSPAADTGHPDAVLQLTLRDEQHHEQIVEYSLRANCIERLVRRADAVQQRESYQVCPAAPHSWSIVASGSRPLVTICLQQPLASAPRAASHDVPPLRVDAVLGLLPSSTIKPIAESEETP